MKLVARSAAPLLLCILCSCAGGPTLEVERSSRDVTTSASVLFIGNSLIATQTSATSEDMPKVLSRLASSNGKTFTYKEAINMGHTLQDTWNANIAQPFLTGVTHYDFIVLQEYSTVPVLDAAQFYNTAVVTYQPSVQRSLTTSGTVLLFENWAVTQIVYPFATFATRADYVAALEANYATLSDKLSALSTRNVIAPLSRAYEKVFATKPLTYLFMDDKHPNDAGVYLDACVFYAVIFGESPVGLPALYMSAADAAFLQAVAAEVVLPPVVPPDAGVDAGTDGGPAVSPDAGVDPKGPSTTNGAIPVQASSAGCSSSGLAVGWLASLACVGFLTRRRLLTNRHR
jgi:hypothetical protein